MAATLKVHKCHIQKVCFRLPYGEKILLIGCWPRFREEFLRFDDSKATPILGVCYNHTHITRESAVMASECSLEAMVREFHIYEDIWDATVGEELPCQRA